MNLKTFRDRLDMPEVPMGDQVQRRLDQIAERDALRAKRDAAKLTLEQRRIAVDFLTRSGGKWTGPELVREAENLIAYLFPADLVKDASIR